MLFVQRITGIMRVKNCKNMFKFVKVIQRKLQTLFFGTRCIDMQHFNEQQIRYVLNCSLQGSNKTGNTPMQHIIAHHSLRTK